MILLVPVVGILAYIILVYLSYRVWVVVEAYRIKQEGLITLKENLVMLSCDRVSRRIAHTWWLRCLFYPMSWLFSKVVATRK